MALLYYLTFTPTGIIMRFLGKDLLNEKIDRTADSYWIKRETRLGHPLWNFIGSSGETNVKLSNFPGKGVYGHLSYDSFCEKVIFLTIGKR